MEDPQTQQDVLSIIFSREIPLVKYNATEKEFRLTPLARSIRMDLFSVDEEQVVYDTDYSDFQFILIFADIPALDPCFTY